MPELPEVETVARTLRGQIIGARVLEVRADAHEKWTSSGTTLDHTIESIRRRGKHLLIDFDGSQTLALHLGMSGVVRLHAHADAKLPAPDRHERMALLLGGLGESSRLQLVDPRGFGHAIMAARDAEGRVALATLEAIGPEPLEGWTAADLARSLARRSAPIKAALLDQAVVAGIGNYLADEILHAAGIHPATPAHTVSPPRLRRLHAAALALIEAAVDAGGATINDYRRPDGSKGDMQLLLRAYGRQHEPCLRCGRAMQKTVIAGRGTTFCGSCQRR